jgi:uncharacterized protein YndB with AHSA1/START domain
MAVAAPTGYPGGEVTIRLADLDGGTELQLTHSGIEDGVIRDKHVHGWAGCLDNLASCLKKRGA